MNKLIVGTLAAIAIIVGLGFWNSSYAQGANCVTPSMVETNLPNKEFKKYTTPDEITAIRAYIIQILEADLGTKVNDTDIAAFNSAELFLSPDESAAMLVAYQDGCMVARQQLGGDQFHKIRDFIIGVSN
jgi:hypothetical protein